ncbi:MAG: hypothetical protein ACLVHV_03555 [Oscillospiraceae bacterium]
MARRLESSSLFHFADVLAPKVYQSAVVGAISREIMPMTVDLPGAAGA